MYNSCNFPITAPTAICRQLQQLGINDFAGAMQLVRQLPYGRNANKDDLLTVFTDGRGTCSTKHALLKQVATAHGRDEVKLMLGIFKMNAQYTPKVAAVLATHQLDYIPEAHNYLRINGTIVDCTTTHSGDSNFINELIEEIEIQPSQTSYFKIAYHKNFLRQWLADTGITLSPEQLWIIREACIAALSE